MTMTTSDFISVSQELDRSGLVWHPEIGDEVAVRAELDSDSLDSDSLDRVSILVDPQGLSPSELRLTFLWLPSVEQLVEQFEARQALIFHAGVCADLNYEAVIRTSAGLVEATARSLRVAFAQVLRKLLVDEISPPAMH